MMPAKFSDAVSVFACLALFVLWALSAPSGYAAPPPTATLDRLATPVMPINPSQADHGRMLYYHNCMPCHGDYGQGLTNEFRQIWPEDHQNCWQRGCHGGDEKDEAWPLPTAIPALIGNPMPGLYHDPEQLYTYLSRTHPPQRPGKLSADEYWALTAFLLTENGLLPPDATLGVQASATPVASPAVTQPPASAAPTSAIVAVMDTPRPGLVMLLALVLVIGWTAFWMVRNRERRS